jgi:hypothetical protein
MFGANMEVTVACIRGYYRHILVVVAGKGHRHPGSRPHLARAG